MSRDHGLPAVANEAVGGRAAERGAIDIRQHGGDGRGLAVAGDADGMLSKQIPVF
jgi:hypothetical protein